MFEFYTSLCSMHKTRNLALTFILKTYMILLILSKILCAESNTNNVYIFYELIYDEPNLNNPELTKIEKYFNFEVINFLSYLLNDLKKTEGSYKDYRNEACEKLKTWIDKSKGFKQCQDKEYQSFYNHLKSFIKCAKDTNVKNKAEYGEIFSESFLVYLKIKIDDTKKTQFAQFIIVICYANRLKHEDHLHISHFKIEQLNIKDFKIHFMKRSVKKSVEKMKNKTIHIISLHSCISRFLHCCKQRIQNNNETDSVEKTIDNYSISRDKLAYELYDFYYQILSLKFIPSESNEIYHITINTLLVLNISILENFKFDFDELCNVIKTKLRNINIEFFKSRYKNLPSLVTFLESSDDVLDIDIKELKKIINSFETQNDHNTKT